MICVNLVISTFDLLTTRVFGMWYFVQMRNDAIKIRPRPSTSHLAIINKKAVLSQGNHSRSFKVTCFGASAGDKGLSNTKY